MTKSKKIFIGILSFLPLLLTLIMVVYVLTTVFSLPFAELHQSSDMPPPWVLSQIFGIVVFAVFLGFLHLGLLIYFIIDAINNPRVKKDERIIWILIFIFVSTIGFPIYWGIRIWPTDIPESNFVKM